MPIDSDKSFSARTPEIINVGQAMRAHTRLFISYFCIKPHSQKYKPKIRQTCSPNFVSMYVYLVLPFSIVANSMNTIDSLWDLSSYARLAVE